ncbi:MAG TPA: hypothetical protein VHE33_11965 [Acidobacteriaceae bacterium]|mgnify:CR=1 FL=1|nr:hypothetical protein [Acidobacteriaceae bacterium]
MKKFLIASCAVLLLPTAAFADHDAEMIIAYRYSDLAFRAPTIDLVHMHLHQVVNCLVGPGGPGFDATYTNPCAEAGNGAIPDAPESSMEFQMRIVLATVNAGLAATDIATAKKYAGDASATINSGQCALATGVHYG